MKGQKRQRLHRGSRRRDRTWVEGTRLVESHIPRNPHPSTNRIPAPIALVLGTVSQKDTLNRLSGQFGAFSRGEENIANAAKQTKGRVVRKKTTETLNRDRTLKSRRGLDVDEVGGSGNSLGPKVRWNRGSSHQCTS